MNFPRISEINPHVEMMKKTRSVIIVYNRPISDFHADLLTIKQFEEFFAHTKSKLIEILKIFVQNSPLKDVKEFQSKWKMFGYFLKL